jgi:hypothetical protein
VFSRDELRLLLEHRHMPAFRDQLQLRLRQVLAVRLAIGRRHQAIVRPPQQQCRTLDAVQALGQLGVVRPLPHEPGQHGHRLVAGHAPLVVGVVAQHHRGHVAARIVEQQRTQSLDIGHVAEQIRQRLLLDP